MNRPRLIGPASEAALFTLHLSGIQWNDLPVSLCYIICLIGSRL